MLCFAVIQTNRRNGPQLMIELYRNYSKLSPVLTELNAPHDLLDVDSLCKYIYSHYSSQQLAQSIQLTNRKDERNSIYVYGRTVHESGNDYMVMTFYCGHSYWKQLILQDDLHFIETAIVTFINRFRSDSARNGGKLIPMRALTNLQSSVDLLCSLNTCVSHNNADLVLWDAKCQQYTQTITQCTKNKRPVKSTIFNQRSSFYSKTQSPSPSPRPQVTGDRRRYGFSDRNNQNNRNHRGRDHRDSPNSSRNIINRRNNNGRRRNERDQFQSFDRSDSTYNRRNGRNGNNGNGRNEEQQERRQKGGRRERRERGHRNDRIRDRAHSMRVESAILMNRVKTTEANTIIPPAGFKWARKSENNVVHQHRQKGMMETPPRTPDTPSDEHEYKEEEDRVTATNRIPNSLKLSAVPSLPSKYALKLEEITRELVQFQELKTKLDIDDNGEDEEEQEQEQGRRGAHSRDLAVSMTFEKSIDPGLAQPSPTNDNGNEDDDDEFLPEEHLKLMNLLSNQTVVIHEESKELEIMDSQIQMQNERNSKLPQRRRSTVAGVLGMDSIHSGNANTKGKHRHHKSHSEVLIDFQTEYQEAQSVQQNLINHLKALLQEVQSDALPSFDDDDEEDEDEEHSDIQLSRSASPPKVRALRLQEELKQHQLACSMWLKLPSSRMQQNGISDGVALMKDLFDHFATDDVPQNEHKKLYHQIYDRIIKHLPYNQHAMKPLLSPSSSSTDVHIAKVKDQSTATSSSGSNPKMDSLRRINASRHQMAKTPYNTPALSRESSTSNPSTPMILQSKSGQNLAVPGALLGSMSSNSSSAVSIPSRCRSSSAPVTPSRSPRMALGTNVNVIEEETEATPKEMNTRSGIPGHRRQRSRLEEIMDENVSLKQQYQQLMGTIGDAAVFQEMFKSILMEVAHDQSLTADGVDSGDDSDKCNIRRAIRQIEREKRRESLRIIETKQGFVQQLMRIEADPEIDHLFWKHLSWDFDPVAFSDHPKIHGNCLVILAWHLIKLNDYHTTFSVSSQKLINFLYQIQEAYQDNPYHNKMHATDVVNNMYWFMKQCHSVARHLSAFDCFVCIIAAAVHDVDHNGKSNAFHRKTHSKLALRYNDKSILENHHISYAFKLIASDSKYDWIRDLSDEVMMGQTRKYLIRLILGTDMSVHKKHVQQIDALQSKMMMGSGSSSNGSESEVVLDEDDKLNLLEVVLHAADISNSCKPKKLGSDWAHRVVEEFRMEGDAEKELFGRVSMDLYSRQHPLEKSQCGWIQYVMIPYIEPLNRLLNGDLDQLMQNLRDNLSAWKEFREPIADSNGNVDDEKVDNDQNGHHIQTVSSSLGNGTNLNLNEIETSFDGIMDQNSSLRTQYQRMMGTYGYPAEFERQFKALLVEVAQVSNSSVPQNIEATIGSIDETEAERVRLKRESLRIMEIKGDLVQDILRIEGDLEIHDTFWKNLSWDFDPVAFSEHPKVNGNCLVVLAWHLIKCNHYHSTFQVSPRKLIHFLYQIQEAYQDNPYHNKMHAADVVNNMYWFMNHCHSVARHLTAFDRFICIMAAAVHDVDHSGKSNAFHQRTASKLALRYNDESIQENHHISYAFKLIASDPKYDWIRDLNDEMVIEQTRKYLIRLILGTDMSVHKKHMEEIEALKSKMGSGSSSNGSESEVVLEEDDKLSLLGVILHAADIANACKPTKLCVDWARRVVEEFRLEGDEQRRLYGDVSNPLFRRDHPLEKGQKGWIQFVMKKYFGPLNKLLDGDLDDMVKHMDNNLTQWDRYKEFEAEKGRNNDDDQKVNM